MKYVHVSAKVERRVENLRQSGKAGNVLARKVTNIISRLTSGAVPDHGETIVNYTKYGEKRIKNCRKYDLGCGYRLITLQRGEKFFIPFLGTHDECRRWLENNSRLKEFTVGKGKTVCISQRKQSPALPLDEDTASIQTNADDEAMLNLSDRDLRRVFCGLVEGDKKRLQ